MTRLESIRSEVLAHPLHSACEMTLARAEDGHAETGFAVNDFTVNPQGILHGGIVYAMVDVSCFFALVSQLPADQHAVTAEIHCSMLRGARRGEQVLIRSRVDRLGRTLAAMRADVLVARDEGEVLIATGSVTKAIVASSRG